MEKTKIQNNTILTVPITNELDVWFEFVTDSLSLAENAFDGVIVDFTIKKFLETDDLVVLACIIEKFSMKGAKVLFIGGSFGLIRHLDNIKFKKYWSPGFNREAATGLFNKSTLCLWKVSESMIDDYAHHAAKYYQETEFKGKDLVDLTQSFQEIFNNIYNHSKSKDCSYVIGQYFPKINKLSFAVCDLGIGIPTSINNYNNDHGKPFFEDEDAIEKSLILGFTVQSTPRNRGVGLSQILEFTESSNGELRITSNHGIITKLANIEIDKDRLKTPFPGTLIRVDIDTTTFEEIDTDEFEEYDL